MEIKVVNLNKSYSDKKNKKDLVISNLNYSFLAGNTYAIIGANGSGKSTFLPFLNGLNISKNVFFNEEVLKKRDSKKNIYLKRKIPIVMQFPNNQIFKNTIEKELLFLENNFKINLDREKIVKIYKNFGFKYKNILKISPLEMSEGEKKKHTIIMSYILDWDFLILDEPTSGIDNNSEELMIKEISKLIDDTKGLILVSHNLNLLYKYANKFIVLKNGKIILQGGKEIFNDSKKFEKKSGIKVPIVSIYKEYGK